jgi:hypothetical protein
VDLAGIRVGPAAAALALPDLVAEQHQKPNCDSDYPQQSGRHQVANGYEIPPANGAADFLTARGGKTLFAK